MKPAGLKARELMRAEYIYAPVCQILEVYIEALTEVVMYTNHRVSMTSYSLKAIGILGAASGKREGKRNTHSRKGRRGEPPMAQVQRFG